MSVQIIQGWIRSWRRTGPRTDRRWDRNRRDYVTVKARQPGPWHIRQERSNLMWCGRDVGRILSCEPSATEPTEGKRCAACIKALASGRPTPTRNPGRRGA